MPRISVIVPIYKTEQYLNQCIESILSQSFQDFELILVDDGSPDLCPGMCDAWREKDQRIKVLHKKNGGASSARNAALDSVKGEYITFVDSDDTVERDYLQTLLDAILEYHADMVTMSLKDQNGKIVFPRRSLKLNEVAVYIDQTLTNFTFISSAGGHLYRAEMLVNKRFREDIHYGEDNLFNAEAFFSKPGRRLVVVGKPLYVYQRERDSSAMNASLSQQWMTVIKSLDEIWHITSNYPVGKDVERNRWMMFNRLYRDALHSHERKQYRTEEKYLRREITKLRKKGYREKPKKADLCQMLYLYAFPAMKAYTKIKKICKHQQ